MIWIVIAVLFTGLVFLAIVLGKYNLKRTHIIKCVSSTPINRIEELYQAIEGIGTEPPTGFAVSRTNGTSDSNVGMVYIPKKIIDFPWSGKTVLVKENTDISFQITDNCDKQAQFLGKKYRLVGIPRTKTKSGKSRNHYDPSYYLSKQKDISKILSDICPKYPKETLGYLFSSGLDTFEFDPINQARIGTFPTWIQQPEFPSCTKCKKKMVLILQLPCTMATKKVGGTFYFFGCQKHPEETATVRQNT